MTEKSGSNRLKHTWQFAKKRAVFVKKHALLFTLLLVLALQFVPNDGGNYPWGGMWMRMEAKSLPVADSAASSSVESFVDAQAKKVALEQYPNLPDANRQQVVNDLKKKLHKEGKAQLDAEKAKLAKEIRDHYSYEPPGFLGGSYVYMPDIDSYHYLRFARNVVETGHTYDELKDGVPWDNHMRAPVGRSTEENWHAYTLAGMYKIFSFFNRDVTLMEAANYFPIVFIFLSLILVFLVTEKIAGLLGGFSATTALALIPGVMSRTPWGHADTDAYNVFFPLLIIWLFMMAISAKSTKRQLIFSGLTGLAVTLFANVWSGWWYLLDFILAALAVAFIFEVIVTLAKSSSFKKIKEWPKVIWSEPHIKSILTVTAGTFVATGLFFSFTLGLRSFFFGTFKSALSFTTIKSATRSDLWPNVLTTVAELNPASFGDILKSVGGKIMLFVSLVGILILLIVGIVKIIKHKKTDRTGIIYSALLTIWFIGTIYAAFKGARFTLLLGPAFAVAFGAGVGLTYKYASFFAEKQLHIKKIITGAIIVLIVGLIIVNPISGTHMVQHSYRASTGSVPIVNDAWWNALTTIKDVSQPDAIINSWWDFGHHFKFIADRAVTFDGASQTIPQSHWIGRMLQTSDEKEAVAILRMLDCDANGAYELAVETLEPYLAVKFVKQIILEDEETAKKLAKEAGVPEEITKSTHCNPPENYFIASQDMIGKAGVWAHFGAWNFERAEIWKNWKDLSEAEAVPKMSERFGWDTEMAKSEHRKANSLGSEDEANKWISPFPGYLTQSVQTCSQEGANIKCGSINIDTTTNQASISSGSQKILAKKITKYERDGTKKSVENPDGNPSISIVIWPTSSSFKAIAANDQLADSMFTRLFFMSGLGLEHFNVVTSEQQLLGGMIYVWKVDWNGSEKIKIASPKPKEVVESGAKVQLNYIGWNDDGIFDSSIVNWKENDITPESEFSDFETQPLSFIKGQQGLIPGFDNGIEGMKKGETKVLEIPPKEGYGEDPKAHPLGGKTLHFKIEIVSVQ